MPSQKEVAVVTGANRGLGFETCRELAQKGMEVVLTGRTEASVQAAAKKLAVEGLKVTPFVLDVTSDQSVERLKNWILEKFGRLDILVNNAGVFLDTPEPGIENSVFSAKLETIRETLDTNCFGAFRTMKALIPIMQKNEHGRVVNISSGMGQLCEMNGGYPAYRVSKTALNVWTRIFADETQGSDILVNSVCPGWVKTDMGGPGAERSLQEGADTIVWAATLPKGGPTGGFFRDHEPIDW